jgi:hypothetical protein
MNLAQVQSLVRAPLIRRLVEETVQEHFQSVCSPEKKGIKAKQELTIDKVRQFLSHVE